MSLSLSGIEPHFSFNGPVVLQTEMSNIILLSMLMSPKWSFPFRFTAEIFVWIFNFFHACNMSLSSHPALV